MYDFEQLTQLQSISFSSKLQWEDFERMSKLDWPNLIQISLCANDVDEKICELMSKINWPNLKNLNLATNKIDRKGIQHLSKSNIPKLQVINLFTNQIDIDACFYLSQANWSEIKRVFLDRKKSNSMHGMLLLESSKVGQFNIYQFEYLLSYICYNNIGNLGCKFLSRAQWPLLSDIDLKYNRISDEGCCHLSKAHWNNLSQLNITFNEITLEGQKNLGKSRWPLKYIYSLVPEMCNQLVIFRFRST